MQATLKKWGNSNALRMPRALCSELCIKEGAKAEVTVDKAQKSVTFKFADDNAPVYSRTKKLTMEDLMSEWSGEKVGSEWTGDIGREVIE